MQIVLIFFSRYKKVLKSNCKISVGKKLIYEIFFWKNDKSAKKLTNISKFTKNSTIMQKQKCVIHHCLDKDKWNLF